MSDTRTPSPQLDLVVPSSAFAEWFNAGPAIAKAADLEVEIVAVTAEGGTLKLTTAGFLHRAALAAPEGSADV